MINLNSDLEDVERQLEILRLCLEARSQTMNRILGVLGIVLGVGLGITIQGTLTSNGETNFYLRLLIVGLLVTVAILIYFTYWLPKRSRRSRKIRVGLITLAEKKTIPNFEKFVEEIMTDL